MKFFFLFLLFFQAQAFAENKTYEVVVVGGGVAGLATVNSLAEKGITNVLLLEQGSRVGGKMWTQRSKDSQMPYYERGAELVNTSDTELISLLKSLGLALTERRMKTEAREEVYMFRERNIVNGQVQAGRLKAYSFEELLHKMNSFPQDREVLAGLLRLQHERDEASKNPLARAQNLKKLQGQTPDLYIKNGAYSRLFFETLVKTEFGLSLSKINTEVLLDYASVSAENGQFKIEIIPGADEKFRVSGGTDAIVRALGERYRSQIRKNTKVSAVRQLGRDNFEISASHAGGAVEKINARHVVMAVPAYDLADIRIDSPDIRAEDLKRAAELPFGHNAKIFLVFRNKFWDRAYAQNAASFAGAGILESGAQFWDTSENQSRTEKGVLTLYPGEWPTDPKEQMTKLAELMAELRQVPGLEAMSEHLIKVDVQNWQKSYAGVFSPAYQRAPRLFAEKLPANIYFVGADKDNNLKGEVTASYGYMNGAVRTALRASGNIIKKLNAASAGSRMKCGVLLSAG